MGERSHPHNMADLRSMSGKRVLVTGSGTGIGSGIAREVAAVGAHVVVHYSRSKSGAERLAAERIDSGVRSAAFGADLADLAAVERLAGQARDFLGGIDVLVNNAGITFNTPFEKVSPEQFDCIYQVNVRGGFFPLQHLLPQLVESKGTKSPSRAVAFRNSFVAAIGGFLFGYDLGMISAANVFLEDQFKLDEAMLGWVTSSAVLGCVLGPFLAPVVRALQGWNLPSILAVRSGIQYISASAEYLDLTGNGIIARDTAFSLEARFWVFQA